MLRETLEIDLEYLTDLPSRLERISAIALEIEALPDQTYAPLGSELTPVEWFSLAAVAKTTSNANAFALLVTARNTIAASAIIRMQIEAGMRLFGLTLVDDVEKAGVHLMGGGKYSGLRMRDGSSKLVDKVLHTELSKLYQWVTSAYEDTSAYVHLDRMNIRTKMVFLEKGGFFNLSGVDAKRPDDAYYDLADTFYISLRMTKALLNDFLATRPQPPERQRRLIDRHRQQMSGEVD